MKPVSAFILLICSLFAVGATESAAQSASDSLLTHVTSLLPERIALQNQRLEKLGIHHSGTPDVVYDDSRPTGYDPIRNSVVLNPSQPLNLDSVPNTIDHELGHFDADHVSESLTGSS